MKNKKLPAYDDVVIVMEMLSTPVYDKKLSGESESPLFHEPLDLVLGLFDKARKLFFCFIMTAGDSNRALNRLTRCKFFCRFRSDLAFRC